MRLRALLPSSLLALGAAALIAGCGDRGDTPDTAGLIGSSLRAAAGQDDASVRYDVKATVAVTPSPSAPPAARALLSEPITLSLSGGAAEKALTVDGELGLGGKQYAAKGLLGAHQSYVNLLGTWYGDPAKGLEDWQDAAPSDAAAQADPEQLRKTMRWIYDHSDEVLDAPVTEGPDIDGPTWQATGHCKPAGIAALAAQAGETMTAEERAGLDTFCRAATLTYAAGADDDLPRRLRVEVDLDRATLAALDGADEITAMKLDLDVKLSEWGDDVEIDAPEDARPMQEAGPALMGLLFSAVGAGLTAAP